MSEGTPIGDDRSRLLLRFRRRRTILFAVGPVLVVLWAAGLMSGWGALLALVAVALALFLVPPQDARSPGIPGSAVAGEGLSPAMRRFAAALPDPCLIMSTDGVIRCANEKAVASFSIHEGEVLHLRLRYPDLVAAFEKTVSGGGQQQVQFVERVPTERSFLASFAPLEDESGVRTILLVLDDLTSFHATERMRADFVANASHELRTPLASLAGFVETLQGPARGDFAAQERFLAIMHEQATRMSRLLDDLLSLSRLEMRAHVRPRERADLTAVLRHVVDTMAPLAGDLGVVIEPQFPDGKVTVPGDRDELIQVFDNLVENACKYGQAGGRVLLRLTVPERIGSCTVSVTDFGPGIAPEHLPRLTERFYRVDDGGRRHRGTGLGLAIVKHIVTRHRARLHIESQPGAGATFSVQFTEAEYTRAAPKPETLPDQSLALS